MHSFTSYFLSIIAGTFVAILFATAGHCEDLSASSINIKQVADGLVVIVNSSQKSLNDVHFDCSEESNEIVVDLPVGNTAPILATLQNNPLVKADGVSSAALPQPGMKRIKITPGLKLSCTGVKLISKFQRYITYLYPAGYNLKLLSADVSGFDFDEENPRAQINGSINLQFDEPLGNVDLAEALNVTDNTLHLRLNPRDFVNQELLSKIFPAKGITIKSARYDPYQGHSFTFLTIHDAVIDKIKAKLIKSAKSSDLRIDLTLSLSLYETAMSFYQRGYSGKALRYMNAAKSDPASALVARMSMGIIFWNDDNFAEAFNIFRELIDLDKSWEFPEARYYAAKAYFLTNNRLSFELSARLKEYLRRCDRTNHATCSDARELSEQVNEPALKLNPASKADLKKLVDRLADPTINASEVQKNIFHYWAVWCPLCLEEMPKIMKYAVAHPNISIYIIAKNDTHKNILTTLIKSGAIKRKNIFYYIDSKDDIMLRQMVPLILANKEPVTPLPISVFLQRDTPFYLTDKLHWTDTELDSIWRLKYQ
jgi:thiol-disulfide isomerase/thioredoxin